MIGRHINERARKGCQTKPRTRDDVFLRQVGVVENERVVAHTEARRHCEMNARRFELADAVHPECRIVRHDRASLRPEGPPREFIVDICNPTSEAKDAAVDPDPVAGADVVRLSRI
jgi:hypothetical protein